MPGRSRLEKTGALMARLHLHADSWARPSWFVRQAWTQDEFFGPTKLFKTPIETLWSKLPMDLVAPARMIEPLTRKLYPYEPGDRDFGLLHGDLHSWNTLQLNGAVYPIDFDDCGDGYRIMDMANALEPNLDSERLPQHAASFIKGYRRIREFPDSEWRNIGLAMASRAVSNAFWVLDMAEQIELYKEKAPKWLASTKGQVENALNLHSA
jgi:Ser/Thr protein kinase RdoA (MazF antagonist)